MMNHFGIVKRGSKKPFMVGVWLVSASLLTTATAVAQAPAAPTVDPKVVDPKVIPKDGLEGAKKEDPKGWNPTLGVSGTVNFISNQGVVGQPEGMSTLFGLGVLGGADRTTKNSVWRNTLAVNEGFAKTPVIDEFIKTTDVVEASSMFNYFLSKKSGVFARLNVKTALLDTHRVTAEDVAYSIKTAEPGGTPEVVLTDNLKIASSLKPITLSESIGGFTEPYSSEHLNVRVRGGIGGRHTLATDVLVASDDAATPMFEMQELANVNQVGGEAFIGIDGKAKGGRVTYAAGINLFLPFINNDKYDRSGTDLFSMGMVGEVKFAVFDWMGIVYRTSFVRDPQLFPKGEEVNQFQNSLLLTFQFTLVEKKKVKPGPTPLEEMTKAKEEAEKASAEAKTRAEELQKQLEELKKAAEEAKEEPATDDGAATDGAPADGTQPEADQP